MRLLGTAAALQAWLLLASGWAAAAGKTKASCKTCQSVAHLLVKARKQMASTKEKEGEKVVMNEIVGSLFTDREKHICSAEKLQPYADYLEMEEEKMVKHCKSIVPDKFEYKSAQDLRKALAEAKPRSTIANLLCVQGGKCEKLWTKEEEPWQNWGKKKAKEEM
mmetsp:Transcript_85757/g.255651  ORF Transcript_85757/g.255651 Transcript_85757/m.255651 type:complete len:164 (-) Transcript_85757:89-580(-)